MRALPIVLLVGCIEPATSIETQEAWSGCSPFLCGENSPTIGVAPFDELHPTLPNADGLRIVSFTKLDGTPMTAHAPQAQLLGVTASGVVHGEMLEGSVLRIEHVATSTLFDVTIAEVDHSFTYFENGNDGTPIETYRFTYVELPGGATREVCPPISDTGAALHHAVIFGGDRIDAVSGTVTASGAAAGAWFNIGCVGDTKSKLLVMRHAEAAQAPAFTTTQAQRTAGLRMFRADYCGTSTPYTIPGVPIDMKNAGGWTYLNVAPRVGNIEAIWNADGALCLTTPRHVALADVACSRPACTSRSIADWLAMGGELMTINP